MLMNNNEYIEIIETIKGEIRGAQYKAALSVNRELIMLYYHIGTVINEHKTWGSKFIENLAADIRIAFPNVKGYSVRNLKYMAKLANTYPDEEFVQQAVAQIPWGHTVVLLDKFLDDTVRNWYKLQNLTGCKKCTLIKTCPAGCSVRCYYSNDSVHSTDPLCGFYKLILPYLDDTGLAKKIYNIYVN